MTAFREQRAAGLRGTLSDARPTLRLAIGRADASEADAVDAVRAWIEAQRAAARGSTPAAPAARPRCAAVRTRADYEAWYPVFAGSGLVVPTWPVAYGGLDLSPARRAPGRAGAARRSTSAGSTRSASTSRRPRCSRTAPRSSGCASCRRSCATRRCGASSSASRRAGSDLASLATRADARRRPLDRDRPEGVDHVGAPRRLRRAARAHRPRRAEARGHHVLPARPAPAGRRGPAAAPHRRRGRLQRGVPRRRGRARRAAGRRGRRRLEGRQRDALGRAADGVGRGLGRRRSHRRARRRSRARARAPHRAATDDPRRAAGVDARPQRGAHPRLDESAGARAGEGRPVARSGELDRQGAPGRPEPAHAAARDRAARDGRDRLDRRDAAAAKCAGCCAAAPTRSRAAPPRSTRTWSASACSACPASPTRGAARRGGRRRIDGDRDELRDARGRAPTGPVGWLEFNRPGGRQRDERAR